MRGGCEWGHSYGIPLYPQHVQSHLNQPRVTQPVVLWLKTPNCNSPGKQGSHAEAVVFWSLNRIEQPIELHTQRDISDIISDSHIQYIHTYIHTYAHTHIHTYIHTHTYIYMLVFFPLYNLKQRHVGIVNPY